MRARYNSAVHQLMLHRMTHGKGRRPRKGDVKAAAERAEKRSKGEKPVEAKIDIDPAIASADEIKAALGRPSKYKPEYAVRAAELCEAGATDDQLADEFGVAQKTINRWKVAHADFRQSIKDAKAPTDDRVQRTLYHRAMGGEVEEQVPIKLKRIKYVDGRKVAEEEYVEMVTVKKFIPPDTTAAIFWLKNRRAKDWRDVHKHEHGDVGAFDHYTDDDLAKYVRDEFKQVEALRSGVPVKSKPH